MTDLYTQPEPRPEETLWERELREVRGLMRNVVVNHERIRERVLALRDQYNEGNIDDEADNWEAWAVDRFAYSKEYLKYLSSPHPLSLDKWEKQQQAAEEKRIKQQKKLDADRSQAVWDEVAYDASRAQVAWDQHQKTIDAQRKIQDARQKVKSDKAIATINKKAAEAGKPKEKKISVPPPEEAVIHLNACAQIERKSRIDLGREYAAMKDKAERKLLGNNPKTGKPYAFVPFCEDHIKRSRVDIYKCIEEFHRWEAENVASCNISQSENVFHLRKDN